MEMQYLVSCLASYCDKYFSLLPGSFCVSLSIAPSKRLSPEIAEIIIISIKILKMNKGNRSLISEILTLLLGSNLLAALITSKASPVSPRPSNA